MIWQATYKDGTVIHEYECGTEFLFNEIEKDQLDKFKIMETGNEMMVHFSADNGIMKFNNLDLRELTKLNGGENLTLTYDSERQQFVMQKDSLKLYDSLALKEESMYNNIEFDQSGKFYINGESFYLSFNTGSEIIDLIGQGPYNEIIHYKKAEVDFIGKKNSTTPYKKAERTVGYCVGYNKVHKHGDNLELNVSLELQYEVVNRTVTMYARIGSNEVIQNGTLILHLGDKISGIPTTMYPNLPPMIFDRTITQLS
jgi:hypothetical protein